MKGCLIKRLDGRSSRLVGAGQAITDVGRVLKEGLENALDAGAGRVAIRLYFFGLDRIEIEDDGCGIALLGAEECRMLKSMDDVSMRDQQFHTSLLEARASSKAVPEGHGQWKAAPSSVGCNEDAEEDSCVYGSLGFRGEALHALAQVGRVEIETSHSSFDAFVCRCAYDPAEAGYAGSRGESYRTAVSVKRKVRDHRGTVLRVSGLFSVFPVRRREAEKQRRAHLLKAVHLLKQYAVSHPWVSLSVTHQESPPNGQTVSMLSLKGSVRAGSPAGALGHVATRWSAELLARGIADAYGGGALARLRLVEWEVTPKCCDTDVLARATSGNAPQRLIHVRGYVSTLEAGGRAGKDWQVWVVEGRIMDLPSWTRAVDSAYRACLPHAMQSRYSAFFLHVWGEGGKDGETSSSCTLEYDVNLSPDKRQVLMVNDKAVADAIHHTALKTFWSWSEGVQPISNKADNRSSAWHTPCVAACEDAVRRQNGVSHAPVLSLSDSIRSKEENEKEVIMRTHKMQADESRQRLQRQEEAEKERERRTKAENFTAYVWRPDAPPDPSAASNHLFSKDPVPNDDDQAEKGFGALNTVSSLQVRVLVDEEHHSVSGSGHQVSSKSCIPHIHSPFPALRSLWCGKHGSTTRSTSQVMQEKSRKRTRSMRGNNAAKCTQMKRNTESKAADLVNQSDASLSSQFSRRSFLEMDVHGQFNLGFIIATVPAGSAQSHQSAEDSTQEGREAAEDTHQRMLMVVDQHASDEKANYERMLAEYVPRQQPLVAPVTLSLDAEEVRLALLFSDVLLRDHGFRVGPVMEVVETPQGDWETSEVARRTIPHPTRLMVHSVPTLPYDVVHPTSISELLQHLQRYGTLRSPADENAETHAGSRTAPPLHLRAVWHSLATKACRTSIMIGTALQDYEMRRIVRRLAGLDHPWSCPHGRPTLRCLGNIKEWEKEMPSFKQEGALTTTPHDLKLSSRFEEKTSAAEFAGFSFHFSEV